MSKAKAFLLAIFFIFLAGYLITETSATRPTESTVQTRQDLRVYGFGSCIYQVQLSPPNTVRVYFREAPCPMKPDSIRWIEYYLTPKEEPCLIHIFSDTSPLPKVDSHADCLRPEVRMGEKRSQSS